MKTQRTIFSNITNKSNFNSNTNKTQKKHSLIRYNSHKRLALTNDNSKRNNKNIKINQGKPLTTNKKKIRKK